MGRRVHRANATVLGMFWEAIGFGERRAALSSNRPGATTHPTPPVRPFVKSLVDLTLATMALIVLAPLFLAIAAAIYLTMGRPIFFRQIRLGYRAQPFMIHKFRTMREAVGPDGEPLSDAERITNLGRLLRKTSLDELPQLWNVMLGELSLVGPRPQIPRYLAMCTPEQTRRHDVLPGITGWAQINGRNSISWDDKVRYDLWYQDHWSLGLDLRILLLTIPVVLWADGVDDQGEEVVSGDSQLSMRPTASGAI